MNVDEAIENFLTCDVVTRHEYVDKRLREKSNFENTYYAYKHIYKKLNEFLTNKEIFHFFEKAADRIDDPNVTVDVEPEDRLLTFVKMKTWYTKGSDMKVVI